MDYIIEFQRREQYDCDGNCVPKAISKTFDEKATLGEIVEIYYIIKNLLLEYHFYKVITTI